MKIINISFQLNEDKSYLIIKQNKQQHQLQQIHSDIIHHQHHLKRIVFVLTNAENRYDVSFINELYHSMPSAVIGRRAINSIMAAYFTELNERFTKNYPNAFDYAKELFKYARENEDVNTLEIAKCLLWPTVAKAKSFGNCFLLCN